MAKHVLNSAEDDLDFLLFGLVSSEDQYSIIFSINRTLGTELALESNVPFNLKDGKLFYFSLFRYYCTEFGLEYFLIPNASNFENANSNSVSATDLFAEQNVEERVKLVKELPKTDYFIILKGEDLHLFQFKIIEKLKTIKEIVQIQNIEPSDLPSRTNLMF